MDVLTAANAEDRHGKTSHLAAAELADLEAFLLQLDETPPDHHVAVRGGKGGKAGKAGKAAGGRALVLLDGGSGVTEHERPPVAGLRESPTGLRSRHFRGREAMMRRTP